MSGSGRTWLLSAFFCLPCLAGCAVDRLPVPMTIEGMGFHHRVFTSPVQPVQEGIPARGDVVHVYIDGDGRPFLDGRHVSADPTPRHSRMLRMMLGDEAPSIYLGRPCYSGLAKRDNCDSRWWTTERYSPTVTSSMVAALERVLAGRRAVLIGYSGGAVLALAMAERMPQVAGIMTLAGNLDVDAWTTLHGYTRLTSPGDVARMLGATRGIPQKHYFGGRDTNVPPALIDRISQRFPQGSLCVLPEFDHDCCWERHWPDLVKTLVTGSCEMAGASVYSPAMEGDHPAAIGTVKEQR